MAHHATQICILCKLEKTYAKMDHPKGGQRVMIEIIISENDDNDGRSLKREYNLQHMSPGVVQSWKY